jgi:hypothetical protein
MKKALKTILITLIAIFALGIFFISPVNAQNDKLVVEYWDGTEWKPLQGPIFSETNFLPGQNVSRLVRVTNNSGQSQRIATEAINVSDPDRLGDVLNLEIEENGITHYSNSLSKFFTAGEVYLSDLANGAQTQYDFIVTFYSGAGNPFQGKSLKFDILIGFQGTGGGLLPGAGTGAGGFLPPGLTIQEESVKVTTTTETSVTITWTTSYLSTSQVIYAKAGENHTLDLTDNVGVPPYPPKYGYARTTLEYDTSPRVTFHSVTIFGLEPGTTYYFRTVSHGSLAISREYTFTTKGVAGITTEKPKGEGVPERGEITETPSAPEVVEVSPTPSPSAEEGKPQISGEVKKEGLGSLLLAGLSLIGNTPWMIVGLILAASGIVYIGVVEWKRRKKKQ